MFIKIFTYHKTINIGAILQSRTLKDFIERKTNIFTQFDEFQLKKILYAEYVKPLITKRYYKFKNNISKNFKIYKWKKKLKNEYSINLKKQFFYSVDPIRLNKISFIINKLKLNSREINEFNKLDNDIDYNEINSFLVNWLSNSKNFLINSINKSIK